ncbi:ABC transporter ATP-binding protein [Kocuria coralli]|uniref:ABC transporter ATP-binding protein n=1 Tax=Kocuria coralli TaxID=1461025 RepID=A0A5J5KT73_9MICC|nr:ABC transporter ATP-binding protein [Kocuria coralli]KAA9392919.1 ABC transporter ATP-binding protein [Kocuria coralli]
MSPERPDRPSRDRPGDGESPDPLKDEIDKDRRQAADGPRRKLSPAAVEVRVRRLALGLLVLIPLVWWLVRLFS